MTRKLLVVDDDEANCRLIRAIFKAEGFDVIEAGDGASGLRQIAADPPDVVLLDLQMPGLDGLQVLEKIRATNPSLPVLMLTASRDIKMAVRATQLGALNYLTKPIDREELVVVVQRALETRALRAEVEELRRQVRSDGRLASQMGSSAQIRALIDQVRTVAASDFTVLILGETGTGKELVAQAIHQMSDRRVQPFVALDCGAIPETLLESELFGHEKGAFTGADRRKQGRFQLAEGGTCFLDEVGNMPMTLQAKLLRALESGEVRPLGADRATALDVRFVAATNDDLQARVARGEFRADLYFRLAQYTISIPPLRDRPDDLGYLAQRFIEEAGVELRRPVRRLAPQSLDVLLQHSWPGNVRELRNVIRRAVLQCEGLLVQPETLRAVLQRPAPTTVPVASVAPLTPGQSLKEIAVQAASGAERRAIMESLRATGGNKAQTARLLRTDYKTLHLKMKQMGLRARDFAA